MRVANFIQDSVVDGPGLRFALFTQGCPHVCDGCHNPATHDFSGGAEYSTDYIISEMLKNPLTDGLTLSGGEPFAQARDCAVIASAAKAAGLSVWAYSGWTFEELTAIGGSASAKNNFIKNHYSGSSEILDLLRLCDVLVDGRFILPRKSLRLSWRGSENQRVLDVPKSLASGKAVYWEKESYLP